VTWIQTLEVLIDFALRSLSLNNTHQGYKADQFSSRYARLRVVRPSPTITVAGQMIEATMFVQVSPNIVELTVGTITSRRPTYRVRVLLVETGGRFNRKASASPVVRRAVI
jgi:hypothetical protein